MTTDTRPRIVRRHHLSDGERVVLTHWKRFRRWGVTVVWGFLREADLGCGFRTRREAEAVFETIVRRGRA